MTTPANIEPWKEPKEERDKFEDWYIKNIWDLKEYPIGSRECYLQWKAWLAAIAAHAPQEPIDAYCPKCDELLMLPQGTVTKEPSVPVSKLKELYNETYSFWGLEETIETIEVSELKELIHQAEKEKA